MPTKAIKRERHVTPILDDIIVKLNGAKIIPKIDLRKEYNQIGIATQAFCTHMGIYQYKHLNFLIGTAAEVFQKVIDSIICGIQGTLNISDDIVISSSTLEEQKRLDRTLNNLQQAGITVNEKKSVFAGTELDFFGMHFSDTGVSIKDSKIEALLNAKLKWTATHGDALNKLKELLTKDAVSYFDP